MRSLYSSEGSKRICWRSFPEGRGYGGQNVPQLKDKVRHLVLFAEEHLAWLAAELQVPHWGTDKHIFDWRRLIFISLLKAKLAGIIELRFYRHIHFHNYMTGRLAVQMNPIMGLVGVLDERPIFFGRLADLVINSVVNDGLHCSL